MIVPGSTKTMDAEEKALVKRGPSASMGKKCSNIVCSLWVVEGTRVLREPFVCVRATLIRAYNQGAETKAHLQSAMLKADH